MLQGLLAQPPQEPVALPQLPHPFFMNRVLGQLFDSVQMHQYAVKYLDLCHPLAAFVPITADDVTDEMVKRYRNTTLRNYEKDLIAAAVNARGAKQ